MSAEQDPWAVAVPTEEHRRGVSERVFGPGDGPRRRRFIRTALVGLLAAGIGFGSAHWLRQTGALTAPDLNFDSRGVTFPGVGATLSDVGAAWTSTPTVGIVVHIVNDDSRSVDVRGGTVASPYFSNGALTPDDTSLAPGQSGTLHGKVKVACNSDLVGNSKNGFTVTIRASAGLGITRAVRLELGDAQFDDNLMFNACSGVRNPIDVTTRVANSGGETVVQVVAHNVTAQDVLANIVADPTKTPTLDTIAAGATTTFTLTTDEACYRTYGEVDDPDVLKTYQLFVKTVVGSFAVGMEEVLPDDPRLTALCNG